ncbi:hypothetical protein AAC387_Pa09g1407 [Persea americana]
MFSLIHRARFSLISFAKKLGRGKSSTDPSSQSDTDQRWATAQIPSCCRFYCRISIEEFWLLEPETTKGEGDLLKSREDPGSLPVLIAVCTLVHSIRKRALLLLTTPEGGWDSISPSICVRCCHLGSDSRFCRHCGRRLEQRSVTVASPSLGRKIGAEVSLLPSLQFFDRCRT